MICLTDYVKKCYDLSTIYLRLTEKGDLFCLIIILRRLLLLPQRIRFVQDILHFPEEEQEFYYL